MITAGITGGIGSGKSLVCKILSKLGASIFYADEESKKLLNQNHTLQELITSRFGKQVFTPEGINRAAFAKLIFEDPEQLKLANSLIHPFVYEEFRKWAQNHTAEKVVFMEAAVLIESGGGSNLDRIILVKAPEETRIQRVIERDQVSAELVRTRIQNQMSEEEKIKYAHYILNNNGLEPLLPQVLNLWLELTGDSYTFANI
jgi:dephospho-CoA kinase